MSTDASPPRDVYLQLIDLLRLNQQQSQFIGSAYGSPLSLLEMYILIELDVDPSRGAAEISALLDMDKSALSRRIAGLVQDGCLRAERHGGDRRRKRLVITAGGRRFLRRHDRVTGDQLAAETARLSTAELSELQGFFKALADGLGAKPVTLRSGEHPLLLEIRRFSRAYRIIGPSLAGSGYSSLEWQILSETRYSQEPVRAADLCRLFGVRPNTMSDTLKRLERRGLIARRRTAGGRGAALSLARAGARALAHIEKTAHDLTENALRGLSAGEMKRFLEIFARYLGREAGGLVLQPEVSVKRLADAAERQTARGFLIFQLVRLNCYMKAPERLLAEDSACFGLYGRGMLHGVCEFQGSEGALRLLNFALAAEYESSPLGAEFLRSAAAQALPGAVEVLLPEGSPAAGLLAERLKLRRRGGEARIQLYGA